jgi:hypothetical protein
LTYVKATLHPFGRIWDDIEAAGAYLSAMNVHNAHNVCYCEHNVVVGEVAEEWEQVYKRHFEPQPLL